MNVQRQTTTRRRLRATSLLAAALLVIGLFGTAFGHALGNFTVNHFARLQVGDKRINIHYVVDMAEVPALQELQTADAAGNGTPTSAELDMYLQRVTTAYAEHLMLTVDGARVLLTPSNPHLSLPPGSGGLRTLRIECDYESAPLREGAAKAHRLRFEDANHRNLVGWHEMVVVPEEGMTLFDSTAYGSAVTDELKAYPENLSAGPLNERTAEFSFTKGVAPAHAVALRIRPAGIVAATVANAATTAPLVEATAPTSLFSEGMFTINRSRDRLTELISVPTLTPSVALFGLLFATILGGLHAMSPGHGKTVVGAYLVGSRGTAKHAMFLGLTVTITHTLGVFALGLVTLFASQYIVPERLFPILSFVSGAIVLSIGLSLFVRRLRGLLGGDLPEHAHQHEPAADHDHADVGLDQNAAGTHSHGGGAAHSHLPPGANGGRVTWRNLLALGISGGLLPCPSALVVLLAAISLHRVGYGLLLVIAFSFGLAATLTGVGLAFVYAGRFFKRPEGAGGRLVRVLPVFSAFVIAGAGAAICYEALASSGIHVFALLGQLAARGGDGEAAGGAASLASLSSFAVLGLGIVFGLKHATEVDHIVAVSTIVSEQRNLLRAALVGGLWGVGHTASLMIVGTVVLALRVAVPAGVASWLEFGVALMIIGLGTAAFIRALRGRADAQRHGGTIESHVHARGMARVGLKPLLVGAMHGLAGSAALTLLVLAQIGSPMLGLLYLTVFGVGSICGMLLMSGLIGLPFALSSRQFKGVNYGLQTIAGTLSIAFGCWYAYETGIASGLLAAVL